MKEITIQGKKIGEGHPVYLIAEAGVNHNGDIEIAKMLIDAAKEAGADAVKFQIFKAEGVVTDKGHMAEYQEKNIGKSESQQKMLKNYELDYEIFTKLKQYCDEKGILFLSTPHSEDAIDFLDSLVPAYKMGSGDLINVRFLRKIAQKDKPMILGTGMSTMEEVKKALNVIYDAGNNQVIMLHCTTNYPCPLDEVNLNAMKTMQDELDCLVGYSDHTMGIQVPVMAAQMGAVLIEKHFTLDRSMEGPDHPASLEPKEFEKMVRQVHAVSTILGSAEKKPNSSEIEIAKMARKSLVAATDIPEGAEITEGHIAVKRPSNGLSPLEYDNVVGKRARRNIMYDELLIYEDLE